MKSHIYTPDTATGNKLAVSDTPPRFGSKADVARMLGMCKRTVDNMLREGLPHLKIGKRRCRFDLNEVAAWLKEQYGQQRISATKPNRAIQAAA